ncbi:hypothetical protein B296_00031523 [Ensete ventricosum]|uniref:Transposase (putative) gypsy type domain-containing protein n=1 Tax=Ensete ventricosum TaxID=4639 RepID=A0A426ZAD0_ENSVE|nr:hypothetical protein B296_00031523 [Ensete ventricosum]
MCISVDDLEVGLRFPLHPLIEECLRWWRIYPSQVAPNSWRYLVVFFGECRGAGIIPTRDLFMACFRLCKSRDNYYLTARVGFRVSGAPSNNKGWKSRYLYVSGPVWGFRLDWSAHPIGNAPSYLSEEETVLVDRLKGIVSSSRAIKEMAELWLVEAGLNPASRGTIILLYFSLSNCSLTCWSGCRSDGPRGAPRDAQGGKLQSPSDPPHRPGGRCFSFEGSPEGFIEEANHHADRVGRGCGEAPQEGQGADEEAQVPSRRGGVSLPIQRQGASGAVGGARGARRVRGGGRFIGPRASKVNEGPF